MGFGGVMEDPAAGEGTDALFGPFHHLGEVSMDITRIRVMVNPSEFSGRSSLAVEFKIIEDRYRLGTMPEIRELCTTVGQQVAYSLACYMFKQQANPEYPNLGKIPMEFSKIPAEQAVENLAYKALAITGSQSVSELIKLLTEGLVEIVRDEIEGKEAKKPTNKNAVIEVPLRTFDFS